jgi:probable DNA metabolism protein
MENVALRGPVDFAGFRAAARRLVQAGVPPEHVSFSAPNESGELFAGSRSGEYVPNAPTFTVSRAFLELACKVALHADPARFALLYRILWRLHDEPRLLAVRTDEGVARAHAMRKNVERDIHKMHAYVRFRAVLGVEPAAFIASFEPTHHIVEEAAPFFVRRFPNSPWTILTPDRSASWDLRELKFGPGGRRADAPADDATEDLWRSYYASIFNPARLKVQSMRGHMPKKYWRNLPESAAIPALIRDAQRRTQDMLAAPPTAPPKHHASATALARQVGRAGDRGSSSPGAPEGADDLADADPSTPLSTLQESAALCRRCELWRPATQTVFGEGPQHARVVFVGEQPGDQEDIAGRPFVGPAGQLFDRALREAGVNRADVYVTNAVKHFKFEPRGKRRLHKTPAQQEMLACRSWLVRELAAIEPELVVALGATAARSLLGRSAAIERNRGTIMPGVAGVAVLVTVHPSYLLRLPAEGRDAAYRAFIGDLKVAAERLRAPPRQPLD